MILMTLIMAAISAATPASRVGEALSTGLAAEARGDAQTLMAAAYTLDDLGAHPAEGEPDLARQWAEKATAMGAAGPAPVWRGRLLGPAYKQGELSPNGHFATRQSFVAGQKADIAVEAIGGLLELSVNDEDGKPVCQVAASVRTLGCRWVPPFTGPSTITITNTGARTTRYYLIVK